MTVGASARIAGWSRASGGSLILHLTSTWSCSSRSSDYIGITPAHLVQRSPRRWEWYAKEEVWDEITSDSNVDYKHFDGGNVWFHMWIVVWKSCANTRCLSPLTVVLRYLMTFALDVDGVACLVDVEKIVKRTKEILDNVLQRTRKWMTSLLSILELDVLARSREGRRGARQKPAPNPAFARLHKSFDRQMGDTILRKLAIFKRG